jgi:hypothetical protein
VDRTAIVSAARRIDRDPDTTTPSDLRFFGNAKPRLKADSKNEGGAGDGVREDAASNEGRIDDMRRRGTALLALGLAAAGLAAWGLAGGETARPPEGDPVPEASASPTAGPKDVPAPSPSGASGLHAATEEDRRRGVVVLRLLNGDTKLPVPGARTVAEGRSAADRVVRVAVETDAHGIARLEVVPAGSAYQVRVAPPEGRVLARHDVEVREAGVTDLGTLYTGAHGRIVGFVVDEQGAGVAEAEVLASMDPKTLAEPDGDAFPTRRFSTSVASTRTDGAGAFVLEEVPVGLVAVQAVRTGRRTAVDRAVVEPGGKPVEMRLLLVRGEALKGRVETPGGRGVAGALVEVGTGDGAAFRPRERTLADDRGEFEIAGFGGGDFAPSVRVSHGDRPPAVYRRVPPVRHFLRLVLDDGAVLAVTVLDDATNDPVRGAWLSVRAPSAPRDSGGSHESAAAVDGRGGARIPVLAGSMPAFGVTAPGYLAGTWSEAREPSHLRVVGDVSRRIAAGETRALSVWMRRGPLLVGSVRGEDGAPVPRARVWLEYEGTRARTVETDGRGEFRFGDAEVVRRPAVVARSPDGTAGARGDLPETMRLEDALVRVDLVLLPDPASGGGAAPLPRNAAKRPATASVRGRTVDAGHRPLAGVRVETRPPAFSDETGAYFVPEVGIFRPPPPRTPTVRLSFTLDGYLPAFLEKGADDGEAVDAPDVALGFGASIRGVVRGPKDRAAGGRVFVSSPDDGVLRSTIVGADGEFELRALAPRAYRVEALGAGWIVRPVTARADVPPPRVELTPLALLEWTGLVVDEAGEPVSGAIVALWGDGREMSEPDEAERGEDVTGRDGRFRLATTGTAPKFVRVMGTGIDPMREPLPSPGAPFTLRVRAR